MDKIIHDFLTDLSTTFPEKALLWSHWCDSDPEKTAQLTQYFEKKFPERFFDILYQNEDIFRDQSIDTCFLPNVSFSELFTANITEHTKQAIWKYLQLILFKVVDSIHSKNPFGDTADLFQGVSDEDLQKKMEETIAGLKDFFQKAPSETPFDKPANGPTTPPPPESTPLGGLPSYFEQMFGNINSENLQEHLKKLMGGKIGTLVEELMEELKDEFGDLEKEMGPAGSAAPQLDDVMKKMMKDPKKLMGIIRKMTDKIKTKMKEGNNQEEFMRETADLFKEMGGREGFMKMFEEMKKTMPKGARINEQALVAMERNQKMKDRMRNNLKKKATAASNGGVIETTADGKQVFRIPGGQTQEKSANETKAEIDEIMAKMGLEVPVPVPKSAPKKKKGGKK